MSGRRVAQVGAVMVGLAGLAVTVPTLAASNGKGAKEAGTQKCCQVDVEVPDGTATAGEAPVRLNLVVSRSTNGCTQTRRTVSVQLAGLTPDQVRIVRIVSGNAIAMREVAAGAGTVQAADPMVDSKLICGETSVAASYRITFLDDAPAGRAEFAVTAHTVSGKLLGSDAVSGVVAAAVALPPAAPPVDDEEEAEPDPGAAPDDEPAPVAPEPGDDATDDSDTAPDPGADAGDEPAQQEESAPEESAADAAPPVAEEPARDTGEESTALSPRSQETSPWDGLAVGSIGLATVAIMIFGALWQLRRRRIRAATPEATTVDFAPAGLSAAGLSNAGPSASGLSTSGLSAAEGGPAGAAGPGLGAELAALASPEATIVVTSEEPPRP